MNFPESIERTTSEFSDVAARGVHRFSKVATHGAHKFAESVGHTTSNISLGLKEKLPAIVIGSLTLIAGLTWNDAFNSLINRYVPVQYRQADNVKVKVLYAFFLSIVIVVIISAIIQYTKY